MDYQRKTFIVGDVGINANGNVENAKKMIDAAVKARFNAVKFQKRDIDKVYTKAQLDTPRESPWGTTNRDQKLGLEFTETEYDIINAYCKLSGIEWFASAWDLNSFKFLKKYDLKYNKVASALLGHKELLEEIAKEKKYTFISTGMSTIEEIKEVLKIFHKYDCEYELMHCNSTYPQPVEDTNLSLIPILKETFHCKVGYSGHETGLMPSVCAVCFGATSVERHITLNRAMYGSDQSASLEPQGMIKLVEYIEEAEQAIGTPNKVITLQESKIREKLYRTKDE